MGSSPRSLEEGKRETFLLVAIGDCPNILLSCYFRLGPCLSQQRDICRGSDKSSDPLYLDSLPCKTFACVICRIEGILRFLRTHTPSSKVLLVGLPPRGVWSGGAREFQWPSIFTVPINSLNHILRRLATGDDHVHYVDCGDLLLYNGKVQLLFAMYMKVKRLTSVLTLRFAKSL